MLVITSLLLTGVIQLFGEDLLLLFGASENTISYAWDYMRLYSLGTLFVQLSLGLNAFINAQGFAKTSMLTVTIGAVCNILLDPLFIFAFHMGVRGGRPGHHSLPRDLLSLDSPLPHGEAGHPASGAEKHPAAAADHPPLHRPGVAPFIMQFTESILSVCFNTSLLAYGGDVAVGAMTILASVMQFTALPLQGLSQGAQPIIGFNYGAGNPDRVKGGLSAAAGLLHDLCRRTLAAGDGLSSGLHRDLYQ